jgi:hypothetical protein
MSKMKSHEVKLILFLPPVVVPRTMQCTLLQGTAASTFPDPDVVNAILSLGRSLESALRKISSYEYFTLRSY